VCGGAVCDLVVREVLLCGVVLFGAHVVWCGVVGVVRAVLLCHWWR
jgi:hypothetical protein